MDRSRHPRDSRKRSRSPHGDADSTRDPKRQRSKSPHHHQRHHHNSPPHAKLPFKSHHLHKRDFDSYIALFAEYLDLQKQINIDQLNEDEVKGRWKSFLGKWNRNELAEGWYDPETKKRADQRADQRVGQAKHKKSPRPASKDDISRDANAETSSNEDDDYRPTLPSSEDLKRSGPAVPSLQDLQHRQELADEDREGRRSDLRYERKQDRKVQKERLDELVPRAEPGTRERQLEKKRESAAGNRAFAEAKESGAEELGEGDLMGDDGSESYKVKMKATEKQKNEREVRKEEVLRARAAERKEKMREHRQKEEKTMNMLKAIAQQRFGGGG